MDLKNINILENNDFVEIKLNQNNDYFKNIIKKKNCIIKKCLSLLEKQNYELDTIKKENQELDDINSNLLKLLKTQT
tara:strand:+ start:348 stop:578 length:231 start_codon:yes stop_codon:yes gene_type:complete